MTEGNLPPELNVVTPKSLPCGCATGRKYIRRRAHTRGCPVELQCDRTKQLHPSPATHAEKRRQDKTHQTWCVARENTLACACKSISTRATLTPTHKACLTNRTAFLVPRMHVSRAAPRLKHAYAVEYENVQLELSVGT